MAKAKKVEVDGQEVMEGFNANWLKGVMVADHVEKVVPAQGGGKETKRVAEVREAAEADVLDWKDYGDRVVLVMIDGAKITVGK